jgi:hypothetical protein
MRVGGSAKQVAGVVAGAAGLALDALLQVDWEAALGDETLNARELAALAEHKAPLVQFRGAWVAIDPRELNHIRARLAGGSSKLTAREAIQAVLAGETRHGEQAVADGDEDDAPPHGGRAQSKPRAKTRAARSRGEANP